MYKTLLLTSLLTTNALLATETIKEYFADGVIKSEIEYRDNTYSDISAGIKEGVEKVYYNTGDLAFSVHNINNLREGEMRWYDRVHHLLEVIHFKKGERHGRNSLFYANGKPRIEVNYMNDKKEGEEKFYFNTGKLASIVSYINGKKEGFQKEYYDNGKLQNQVFYKNGYKEGEKKWYDENGTHIKTEIFKMNRPINLMKKVQTQQSYPLIKELQGLNFNPNSHKTR